MKMARFVFTIVVGLGALTLGRSFADEAFRQPYGQRPSEHQTSSDLAGRAHHSVGAENRNATEAARRGLTRPTTPVQGSEARTFSGNSQPGLNKAAIAAKDGLTMNTIGKSREQPARLPVGSGSTTPSPTVVHGRGANATMIGGLAISSVKNSAPVINGTGMNRKP
jgi:hypothetical protein